MLILASNSPRRKQLLSLAGWEFSVLPADVDETPLPAEKPDAYVLRLAESKARWVALSAPAQAYIIAADTAVVDQAAGESLILGKPADADEAAWMLHRLRGKVHQVYTGLAILRMADESMWREVCVTDVPMRAYSAEEIAAYIASGDPMDKAGAYAIQHAGFHPVEAVRGCFTNVMGLPLCRVVQQVTALGYPPPVHLPFPCLYSDQPDCAFSVASFE